MSRIWPYFGNLHAVIDQPWLGIVLVLCSMVCGAVVGLEREHKRKPAGLRTLGLICVGSTLFTISSLLVAGAPPSDPGRIAAQVVTGIGFLGAGAIIRDRGSVVGLTTAAAIWVVAAIGILVGLGYGAAGIAASVMVVLMLTGFRRFEPAEAHRHRPPGDQKT